MSHRSRDLSDYAVQYQALPFESVQSQYRRALVLREISRCAPRRLLEIGCGNAPLFTDLPGNMDVTIVEPATAFSVAAQRLVGQRQGIHVVNGFVEDYSDSAGFDMVVLSCLLHEVEDPAAMLEAVHRLCNKNTVLHVNVPNARSLHRLLAVSMGLIPEPGAPSETQRRMQQRATTYDTASLRADLMAAGFEVIQQGSLLVKPFTHAQMQWLLDSGFMTPAMLDGFDKLVNELPDLGSEIWANARRTA